jgi:hypothetical protein
VVEEVSKYKLDLVGVQEVRWGGGSIELAGPLLASCSKFTGKSMEAALDGVHVL